MAKVKTVRLKSCTDFTSHTRQQHRPYIEQDRLRFHNAGGLTLEQGLKPQQGAKPP